MKTLRDYILEAEAPQDIPPGPDASRQEILDYDAKKYGTYDQHAQAAQKRLKPGETPQAQAQASAVVPKLVTPTADQLKAQYKDVGAVGRGITSSGQSPEEQAEDKRKTADWIARLKSSIARYNQQGKTQMAAIQQKQLDQAEAYAKRPAGQHDPDSFGTMDPAQPWSKLVGDVRGLRGPAYTGVDNAAETAPPENPWETMAKALAMPAGQALFLHGDVAVSLLHKLNPWADDPAVVDQVRRTLPDYNEVAKGNIGESRELDRILTLINHRR